MFTDALARDQSCGGHFREEHQTADGEALRDDENFASVFAWEYQGNGSVAPPKLHRERLVFEQVELKQRREQRPCHSERNAAVQNGVAEPLAGLCPVTWEREERSSTQVCCLNT